MSTKDARESVWTDLRTRRVPHDFSAAFAADPDRARRFTVPVGDLLVDMSKNPWDDDIRRDLLRLADAADVGGAWRRMRSGEPINLTEGRAVGHTWLRAPRSESTLVDGVDVVAEANDLLDRALHFVDEVHAGRVVAADGSRFTDIVNVGIGGSDLGPRLAYEALRPYRLRGIRAHFISNVDPANAADVLGALDPRRTLVVIASKTFTTEETMANARSIREWLPADGVTQICAVTSDPDRAIAWGIAPDRCFAFREWVGGRYSIGSSVGLVLALAIGSGAFREFLAGQRIVDEHVDEHVDSVSANANVPLLLASLGIWNAMAGGVTSKAVVPYSYDLRSLPAFLQQLDMESNGKSVHRDGTPVSGRTAPIVWGAAGTDAQHAFFQLLHQGTQEVAVDLIGFAAGHDEPRSQHDTLVANLIAQSRALAFGRPESSTARLSGAAHRRFPGHRPNTVILAPRLTPSTLGQIIALYEHVVFFQGWLWDINSFDQYGVELGKEMATEARSELDGRPSAASDSSTRLLTEWCRARRSASEA